MIRCLLQNKIFKKSLHAIELRAIIMCRKIKMKKHANLTKARTRKKKQKPYKNGGESDEVY